MPQKSDDVASKQKHNNCSAALHLLLAMAETQLATAQNNLLEAASFGPIYGCLLVCILLNLQTCSMYVLSRLEVQQLGSLNPQPECITIHNKI